MLCKHGIFLRHLKVEMGIWEHLFGKLNNTNRYEHPLPAGFNELTKRAIELIGRDSGGMENEQLHEHLIANGISSFEAGEFIIFLPTVFCRKLLPELDWPLSYVDCYSEKRKIKRRYLDNIRYVVMQEETEKYWKAAPNNKWVLNIAGRSAEFNAINQLLNNGGKLEDVRLTELYVVR